MDSIYFVLNPWWEGKKFDSGIERTVYTRKIIERFGRRQVEVLAGGRRVGKTFMLKQLIKSQLDGGAKPESILYLTLDHPQLSGRTIMEHLTEFRKNFMHDRDKELSLYLDEVQESPGWETQLKALYDTENIKIVCTGSTASLLQGQGGGLTGRQIVTTIYPLSFREYMTFRGAAPDKSEDYKYERLAEEYLHFGGYPENVLHPSGDYMLNLLEDILARDLIRLHSLKKPWLLKGLLQLLAASVGSRTSYNKMAHALHTTVETVKEYVGCLESAFLVKGVVKHSASHTDRIYSARKMYLMDTGFKTLLTGEGDLGAKAENAVYLKLLRDGIPCGYYAESEREVDFVCSKGDSILPVEVKYSSQFDWADKRYSGLKQYLRRNKKIHTAYVVSKDVEEEFRTGNVEIKVTPLWKFLLEDGLSQRPYT